MAILGLVMFPAAICNVKPGRKRATSCSSGAGKVEAWYVQMCGWRPVPPMNLVKITTHSLITPLSYYIIIHINYTLLANEREFPYSISWSFPRDGQHETSLSICTAALTTACLVNDSRSTHHKSTAQMHTGSPHRQRFLQHRKMCP